MKKAFYILFSIYFLTLTFVPCGDKDDCNEVNHTTQTTQTENHEHQDEACTPLCVCSCCATQCVTSSINGQIVIASTEVRSYRELPTSKVRGAVLTIWQPPKIA